MVEMDLLDHRDRQLLQVRLGHLILQVLLGHKDHLDHPDLLVLLDVLDLVQLVHRVLLVLLGLLVLLILPDPWVHLAGLVLPLLENHHCCLNCLILSFHC